MGQSRNTKKALTAPGLAAALVFVLSLAGCDTKQQQGTVAGAVVGAGVGALFGSGTGKIAAIAGGAVLGGITGNLIGKNMDKEDKVQAQQAMTRAETADVGDEIAWNNPESGNSGTIEVTREGADADGNDCREFKHTVMVNGETREDTGIACRRPDAKWVTIE